LSPSAWATPSASEKWPIRWVPRTAYTATTRTAAAPPTTTNAPSEVSARSYLMNRGVIRLSMTLDCWKNSCHGATVVPTIAMTSSTASELIPPWMPGTTKW
jgi:hypothetical protein